MIAERNCHWFEFNGIKYAPNTEVCLTPEAYQSNYFKHYANQTFVFSRNSLSNTNVHYFKAKDTDLLFTIKDMNLIKEITQPVYFQPEPRLNIAIENSKKQECKPDTFNGWCWYIILMFLSVFTASAIGIMILLTIVFIDYLVDKYNI